MKILLVNKFHYLKGGSEKYYFELAKLLNERGHEVAFFSMKDERNIITGEKEYLVDNIDLNNASKMKAFGILYSRKNKKKMKQALEEFKPDIVHLNNFQRQLSPSIIKPIKNKNIPIVFTMHDLQAICPAITMVDNDGCICEKCMNGKYNNCLKKKCNKKSYLKSFIGMIEGYYYRLQKIYNEKINRIITPTDFYAELLKKNGINENKIISIHNFIDEKEYDVETKKGEYAVYVGRLAKEKGVDNILEAFKRIDGKKLHIVGDGKEKEKIYSFIHKNNLEENIKVIGFLNKEETIKEIANSKFVIVPSIWYENGSYSAIESSAIGKAVLASNIGGIPEVILDGYNGFLYKYDDIEELTEKINKLFDCNNLDEKYGRNGKKFIKEEFSSEKYYKSLIKVYEELVKEMK